MIYGPADIDKIQPSQNCKINSTGTKSQSFKQGLTFPINLQQRTFLFP